MSVRTAVVLAAGEGTRLRPLTRNRPKPMLPAANRPIIEHVFDALIDAGISRIVVVVGYKRDRVQDRFGPTYRDVPITYVTQDKQLGSGHALLQARSVVDESMLVVNGDRLIDAGSVEAVLETFATDPEVPALAVLERADVSRYGAVEVRDGDLEAIVEKPDSDEYRLINGGIYAFPPAVFSAIEATPRSDGELELPDTIDRLVDERRVQAVRTDGMWVDATYPWDLLAVAREVLARGRVTEPQRAAGVWVDESAHVHPDATVQAPVVVGPDCEIAAGAVVGPDAALGANVTVGATVALENAVLDDDARIGAGSTLVDAVVGQDAHLGVNTAVPGGPADVTVGTEVFEDRRLGAVIADRVAARGNVSLVPGTLVGPSVTLGTGVLASGQIPEGAEVVR